MEGLKKAARESGLFMVVDSDLDYNNPVVQLKVDRAKANSLGVTMKPSATRWPCWWARTT